MKLIPIVTEHNKSNFVDNSLVKHQDLKICHNTFVKTAPLLCDKDISLLGNSTNEDLLIKGIVDNTDDISTNAKLTNIYLMYQEAGENKVIAIDVSNYPAKESYYELYKPNTAWELEKIIAYNPSIHGPQGIQGSINISNYHKDNNGSNEFLFTTDTFNYTAPLIFNHPIEIRPNNHTVVIIQPNLSGYILLSSSKVWVFNNKDLKVLDVKYKNTSINEPNTSTQQLMLNKIKIMFEESKIIGYDIDIDRVSVNNSSSLNHLESD